MFNPTPIIQSVAIAPGQTCWIIDDALTDPERWVALASEHARAFELSSHNAYPGPEFRMPESFSAQLDAWFAQHIRSRLGACRTIRMYSRLALATRAVSELEPRQWICHRDRLDTGEDRCIAASVLYLFKDPALGGTCFFVPRQGARETEMLIHESGQLEAEAFTSKYAIRPSYPIASNDWFERTGSVDAKWNRIIFYDGGRVFHASDIDAPERLSADPARGRLTLNGFFICRVAAR